MHFKCGVGIYSNKKQNKTNWKKKRRALFCNVIQDIHWFQTQDRGVEKDGLDNEASKR